MKWTGIAGTFWDSVKYDGRTLEKQLPMKATSSTLVAAKINMSRASDFLFTKTP